MKIAILGTRGIPNNYGGFEQFAQYLAEGLVKMGHQVWVYNSHSHPYREKLWNDVNIVHCYDPEDKIGTAGQFIYDFNCIRDSRKRDYDVILQLGYTSSSIWGWLLPEKPVIVTNMDGLEWKRTKFSPKVRRFLKYAEKLAIKYSDYWVSDSLGIQKYLLEKFNVDSTYIAYGAEQFSHPDENVPKEFGLTPSHYNMLIARLEPENNIETILDGVVQSKSQLPFLVVGNHNTHYGNYLKGKFGAEPRIKFLGAIYDQEKLNHLRWYSNLYFHGHSVGGTNPSLLEAMASKAFICAHNNDFNRGVLDDDAFYFTQVAEISDLLDRDIDPEIKSQFIENNYSKIANLYNWDRIIGQYEKLLREVVMHPSPVLPV